MQNQGGQTHPAPVLLSPEPAAGVKSSEAVVISGGW